MTEKPSRKAFVEELLRYQGAPYIWKGKGECLWTARGLLLHDFYDEQGARRLVFDCSGAITRALRSVGGPDWRAGRNANAFGYGIPEVGITPLARTTEPKLGDVACYGFAGHIIHVMAKVDDEQVYGACGGGAGTTTLEIAAAHAAYVKHRPNHRYRDDFMFWVSMPLSD